MKKKSEEKKIPDFFKKSEQESLSNVVSFQDAGLFKSYCSNEYKDLFKILMLFWIGCLGNLNNNRADV